MYFKALCHYYLTLCVDGVHTTYYWTKLLRCRYLIARWGIRRIVPLIHLTVPHSVFLREESCVGPADTWYVIPRHTPSHHTHFPGITNTRDGA